jgi:hypothetical protein
MRQYRVQFVDRDTGEEHHGVMFAKNIADARWMTATQGNYEVGKGRIAEGLRCDGDLRRVRKVMGQPRVNCPYGVTLLQGGGVAEEVLMWAPTAQEAAAAANARYGCRTGKVSPAADQLIRQYKMAVHQQRQEKAWTQLGCGVLALCGAIALLVWWLLINRRP